MRKDILELIKKTGATRKFKDKKISDKAIRKILEAGRWGLSILGIQPWKLVCVKRRKTREIIASVVHSKSLELDNFFENMLKLAALTIKKSKILIAVYNTKKVMERTKKYGEPYVTKARIAEIQLMGAIIQNMVLEASSLGLGSVWLDSPTFFNEKEINRVLKQDAELIAILVLGYPAQKNKRSKRTKYDEMIEVI